MKALLLFALIACAVTAIPTKMLSEETMDDLTYMDKLFFNMWNGFVRGLYREHTTVVVDQECFGDWVSQNLTHLDDVMSRVFDFQFDITFEEAKEAAVDVVNLFYKNMEYCKFKKVFDDLYNFCGPELTCIDMQIFTNIQQNVFPMAMKIEHMFELLMKEDPTSDAEVFAIADGFGEDYGAILSYVLGFDKRFLGGVHLHKTLELPSFLSFLGFN